MRAILVIILMVVGALLVIALATGAIVVLAAGVAWVLVNPLHLPFSMLEATVLTLIATCLIGWIAVRLGIEIPNTRRWRELEEAIEEEREKDEADEEDEDEEDDSEVEIVGEEGEPPQVGALYAWEPPAPRAEDEVPEADPNQRCPCGSGRKYKNCHGRRK